MFKDFLPFRTLLFFYTNKAFGINWRFFCFFIKTTMNKVWGITVNNCDFVIVYFHKQPDDVWRHIFDVELLTV